MFPASESRPLTPETWADLESLFDVPGGSIVRGCWCKYYRKSGKVVVSVVAGADNKRQLCELVDAGVVPGLTGYVDGPGHAVQRVRRARPRLLANRIGTASGVTVGLHPRGAAGRSLTCAVHWCRYPLHESTLRDVGATTILLSVMRNALSSH